jgi:putative PEP-CTERM system TPR-repeat lipoprotein
MTIMNKSRILPLLAIVVVVGAGGAYGFIKLRHDPLRDGRAFLAKGDLRGAAIDLRAAVRDQPSNQNAHFALGQLDLRSGDPIAAEKELRTAADLGYDKQAVAPLLAQADLDQGKFRELLAEFPEPRGIQPADAMIFIARGLAQFGLKDTPGALASIAQAERIRSNDPDAPFAAARVALASRDLALAEQKIDRTLELSPQLAPAHFVKAQILSARGDKAGAIEALTTAIAQAPHYTAALLTRANLLLDMHEDARARKDVDVAMADAPANAAAVYFDMILLVRKQDFAAADTDLQKLSTVMDRFPRALFFQALVKARLGQKEQALDAIKRFVAQHPDDLDGAKLLAQIYMADKRPDLAAASLDKAKALVKPDAEFLSMLAQAYTLTGRPADAVSSLAEASKLAPQDAATLSRLASARLTVGDAEGASQALEQSLAITPNQPATMEALTNAAFASGDLDQVRAAIARLRTVEGDSEAVGNFEGLLKVAELDLPGAKLQFDKVLAAFPDSLRTQVSLVKLMGMQGDRAGAEQSLNALVAKYPTDDVVIGDLVVALLADNKLPDAIDVLQKAHLAAPNDDNVTASLADLLVRTGEPAKAVQTLDDAIKNHPTVPRLLGSQARALVALGRKKDAIEVWRKALAANPLDAEARAQLIDLLIDVGDYDPARSMLREALRRAPGSWPIMANLMRLETKAGGLEGGLVAADQLAADPANLPAARSLKGDLYANANQPDKAAEAYAAELKRGATSDLTVRYAATLQSAGKPAVAVQVMQDWLTRHPDDIGILKALSSQELAGGQYKEAAGHLQRVLDKFPNEPAALNNIAWTYQQLGDPRALAFAQRAYVVAPTADSADTYGWLLTSAGQAEKGVIALRFAASLAPENGAIMYHYAVALKDTGARDEAVRSLAAALAAPAPFDGKDAAKTLLADLSTSH